MVQLNHIFKLTRQIVFGVTSLFAFIVLILSGLITNFTDTFFNVFYDYAALGIATSLLTLLTLPTMLALSIVRKGIFTSMIGVEIGWIWFLWILWLAVAGDSAGGFTVFFFNCDRFIDGSDRQGACNESQALTAFAFLCWFLLMFYGAFLATLTFRQHLRGNTGVWTSDVTETDFIAAGVNNNVYENKVSPNYPNQYPPAGSPQQSSYTQQAPGPNQAYPQPQATPQAQSPYPQV
jgi:hypothetical protein